MLIRVLGHVDVVSADGDNIALGGPTQYKVLALLVARGDAETDVDDLVTHLWPDGDLPDDPVASLRTYVARVRRALGSNAIKTGTGTYRLGEVATDVARFEGLVERARRASGSPAAADLWRQALSFWRGPDAYGEHHDLDLIRPAATRLEELRAEATEAWFDARLAAGEARELVADIDAAVGQFPFREGFRAQQMTALARAGRQADALRAFQEFRSDLTEVGLQPSERLQELDGQIADGSVPSTGAGRRLRGYELGERLGEGAFAVVYRATQASVGRDVAVKQIRGVLADQPEFIRQFETEAHLVARLEHPHIVPLYDYWREPGSAYLVMRHLEGGSLAGRLLDGPVSPDELIPMVGQLAAALDSAHAAGVIHRDVKPANLLLDTDGNAYLSDFGIAVEEAERLDPEAWLSHGSPAYAAPEQLQRLTVGPTADVYALGVTTYEALTGELPFPAETTMAGLLERQLHDPIPLARATNAAVPGAVDTVIQRATAKSPGERYATAGEFAVELSVAAGLEGEAELIRPEDRNPYKGLAAFDEGDAADFAGRDRLVNELLGVLNQQRAVMVIGPSGSGKSSVVRAGVLPAVRQARVRQSDRWFVTTMVPGQDPFDDLESALLRIAVNPPADPGSELRRSAKGLARLVRQLVPNDQELLLVIDQFEELFTLTADRTNIDRFLDALVAAVTEENSRLRVVATLRADFYDHPLRHADFARLVRNATVPVHPLAPDELERAVTEPARTVGASFERGLVAEITADVADQPGALPLLQYALTELYDHRTDHVLTRAAYLELGGVTGALARRAEELFTVSPNIEQEALQRIIGRLVTLGEGTEDTRRRVLASELGTDNATKNIIRRYGDARFLSFDRDPTSREQTVEVAHEALIREWPRLRSWLDRDRDGLRVHRHLSDAATAWDSAGRPDSDLYRGGRLEAAEEWNQSTKADLNAVERAFVTRAADQREYEAAAEKQQVSRLRKLLATVGVVAALALIAGSVAFVLRNRANNETARANLQTDLAENNAMLAEASASLAEERLVEAELNALVSRSTAEAGNRPDLGLLLSVAAHERCDGCIAGQSALLAAMTNVAPRAGVSHQPIGGAYIAGDYEELGGGRWIVRSQERYTLLDASTPDISSTLLTGGLQLPSPLVRAGRTSPDGGRTVLQEEGSWVVRSTENGSQMFEVSEPGGVVEFRWVPGGAQLAVIRESETGSAMDLVDGNTGAIAQRWELPFRLTALVIGSNEKAALYQAADDPDVSSQLAIMNLASGTIETTYEVPSVIPSDPDLGTGWAASDSGVMALSGFEGALIVDTEDTTEPVFVSPGKEGFSFVGLSPDGRLAYFHQESGLKAYDTSTGNLDRSISPTFERGSAMVTGDGMIATLLESGVVEVIDPTGTANALSSHRVPFGSFFSSIHPQRDLVMTLDPSDGQWAIEEVSSGQTIGKVDPSEATLYQKFTTLFFGSSRPSTAGTVLSDDFVFHTFRSDGSLIEAVDMWPDTPAVWTGPATLNHGLVVAGMKLGFTPDSYQIALANGNTSPSPDHLLVFDAGQLKPVGEPIDLSPLEAEAYRAVPIPDGGVVVLTVDGLMHQLDAEGNTTLDPVMLPDIVAQMRTDPEGDQAVLLYRDGGGALVDLETMWIEHEFNGLPGHRDVQFTGDGRQLVIQDGRGRTLLYDIAAAEEVGFLAGGGQGSAAAGAGLQVNESASVWLFRNDRWLEVSLNPNDWKTEACRLAGRELTDDEWAEFVPGDERRRDICT